ncbi:MAG: hypothetical protein DRJ01_10495 [Bacteroidetes bacterium]|nr:MAG: hypothetical protein DRJ01_10495 [Bacteroidota bacterium]
MLKTIQPVHFIISFTILFYALFFASGCKKEDNNNISDIFYVRHAGADIPAYLYGSKQNNVFIITLHGGPGDNGLEMRQGNAAAELEKRYVMVYWDQRGQGLSEGKFSANDITIDLMAEDLQALILVLKHKYGNNIKLFLLGHSWGGELGTAFLLKNNYQHQLKGWIEVDGAYDIPKVNIEVVGKIIKDGNEQINLGNSTEKWEELIEQVKNIDTNNISITEGRELNKKARIAQKYLFKDDITQKPQSVTWRDAGIFYHEDFLTAAVSGSWFYVLNNSFYNEIETASYSDKLCKITIPTLLLWGKYDFIVPPALGRNAFKLTGSEDKKLVIFNKSSHSPMNNQPEEFVDEIIQFVEGHQ